MVQTWLAGSPVRLAGGNPLSGNSREIIIAAGKGVHLSGYLTLTDHNTPRGLAVLIHGWEGSAEAPYIVRTGHALVLRGYDVFRLNLRDHGRNHHLNRGIFMGTLIDETFGAVKNIAREYNRTDSLYLLGKWKASLRIKEEAFPHIYDFKHIFEAENCMDLTEDLIPRHSDCASAADYFSRYTLKEGFLDRAAVPVTIITSEDDPIIHAEDFRRAERNGNVDLIIEPYGGHCGYIENLSMGSWLEKKVPELFSQF